MSKNGALGLLGLLFVGLAVAFYALRPQEGGRSLASLPNTTDTEPVASNLPKPPPAPIAPLMIPPKSAFDAAFPNLSKECRSRVEQVLRFNAESFAVESTGSGAVVSDENLKEFAKRYVEVSKSWPKCTIVSKTAPPSAESKREFGQLLAQQMQQCGAPPAVPKDAAPEMVAFAAGQHAIGCFALLRDVQMQTLNELYRDTPADSIDDRGLITRLVGGAIHRGASDVKEFNRTRELAARMAILSPEDVVAQRLAAQTAFQYLRVTNNDTEARREFEKTLDSLEHVEGGAAMSAELKLAAISAQGDWQAVEDAAAATRNEQANADVGAYFTAQAKMHKGDTAGARKVLEELLQSQPGNTRARIALNRLSDPKTAAVPEMIFPQLADNLTFQPGDLTSSTYNTLMPKPADSVAPMVVR